MDLRYGLYDAYLNEHRINVQKAYEWLYANIPEMQDICHRNPDLDRQIAEHDASKEFSDEYTPYAVYFYGTTEEAEQVKDAYNVAWLLHQHRNPHHWQYWLLRNDNPKEGAVPLEMPIPYVIEMLADWMSFGIKDGDISEVICFYRKHKDYMQFHPNTRKLVETILSFIWRTVCGNDLTCSC